MTCKHLLNGAPDCVFCHRDQLRGELSLAEEGLANYQQQVEQLQAENVHLVKEVQALEATVRSLIKPEPQPALTKGGDAT